MLLTRALREESVTWMRLLKRLGPELDEAIDIEEREVVDEVVSWWNVPLFGEHVAGFGDVVFFFNCEFVDDFSRRCEFGVYEGAV